MRCKLEVKFILLGLKQLLEVHTKAKLIVFHYLFRLRAFCF